MSDKRKIYYGIDTEVELLTLLINNDTGAYFEIVYRHYHPLVTALSESLIEQFSATRLLSDYTDYLLQAEYFGRTISHNTFKLLWEDRENINSNSLYLAIIEILKAQLVDNELELNIVFNSQLENKILSHFYLQPRQILVNARLREYLTVWISREKDINKRVFIMRFFEGKTLTEICTKLDLSLPEIESQFQLIYQRFEAYLKVPANKLL
jgi:DNA-directed RNA polymerase specialized sigma24 family protein